MLTYEPRAEFKGLRSRIHRRLVDLLTHSPLPRRDTSPAELRREVRLLIEVLLRQERVRLNRPEQDQLIEEVLDMAFPLLTHA